jgi:hypothetical protein
MTLLIAPSSFPHRRIVGEVHTDGLERTEMLDGVSAHPGDLRSSRPNGRLELVEKLSSIISREAAGPMGHGLDPGAPPG